MVQQSTAESANLRSSDNVDAKQSERSTQGIRKVVDHMIKHEMHNSLARHIERAFQGDHSSSYQSGNVEMGVSDPLAQTDPMSALKSAGASDQTADPNSLELPQVGSMTAASQMAGAESPAAPAADATASAAAPVADSTAPTSADGSLQSAMSNLTSDMSNFMSDLQQIGQDFEQIGQILESLAGGGSSGSGNGGGGGDAPPPASGNGGGGDAPPPATGNGGGGDAPPPATGNGGGGDAPPPATGNGGGGDAPPPATGNGGGGDAPTPTNDTTIPPVPSDALNVHSFGAKGDGSTDDTDAIQAALNQASKNGGGAVYIPPGTYMISSSENGKGGLQLPSNVQLFMDKGTTLESEANDSATGQIINISNATNSAIYGGVLNGNEAGASANDPEYNHGLRIGGNSSNITIQGVTSENNTGDGFYVAVDGQSNITFNGVVSDNNGDGNGRNDLSVTRFQGNMLIENSTFENADSTGIDVEPNPGNTTSGIHIINNLIENNKYGGVSFGAEGGADSATSEGNEVSGNTFINDGSNKHHDVYIELGPQTVTNNKIETSDSIDDVSGADNNISGNTVTGN